LIKMGWEIEKMPEDDQNVPRFLRKFKKKIT
jgi:hypothetical protein